MDSNPKGDIGEKAVNQIAFHTYLKYWCYPNPKDERGSKKEICDLLILFKQTAIIISIKNYAFKGNYERYFNSTLKKAVAQIRGAERKLFDASNTIYLKHDELGELKFDPTQYSKIQRIVINLNDIPLFYPGGQITKNKDLVHIFNWKAFLGVVLELNTIPDLINYLETRETLSFDREIIMMIGNEEDWDSNTQKSFFNYNTQKIPNKNLILFSGTEMDLLADYLTNGRKFNKHLTSREFTGASIQLDGKWNHYLSRKEVIRKKEEDRKSYFVDEFVKREVLYKTDVYNLKLATELLSLNRFERRIVGHSFFDFADKYKDQNDYFIGRRYGRVNDLVIAFLIHGHKMEHEHIMAAMQLAVEGYYYWDNYKTKKMTIIAVSNNLERFRFGYSEDVEKFTKEYEDEVI